MKGMGDWRIEKGETNQNKRSSWDVFLQWDQTPVVSQAQKHSSLTLSKTKKSKEKKGKSV